MAGTPEGSLVEAARAGDSQAFGKLFDTWFDKVHDLSRRIVRDPGTAGEVAQDTFLAAWTRLDSLDDPDAFGGWLLRIARNKSLNRLEKERRSVALDHDTMTTLTDLDAPDHDPLAHLDQAGRVALVWDAAAALGERDRSILDLHLRHGLGPGDLAEELGTTANNAHQILFTLRKRLGTNVRALVLWRAGRPACENLRRTLSSAGIATFDKQAVKVIDRHAEVCDDCSRERSDRLAPAALFGAAPVVAAPFLLKAQAASALEAAGVPMGGSSALAGGSTAGSAAGGGTAPGATSTGATSTGAMSAAAVHPLPTPLPTGGDGPSGSEPSGTEPSADPGAAPAPANRRVRILAVAAVVLVLVGVVLVLGGVTDGDGGDTEVAAVLPATSLAGATTTDPGDGTGSTTAEATSTTAAGGFEMGGGDTTAPGPTDPGTVPPGPVPPPPTGPGSTSPTTVAPTPTTAPSTTTTAPTTTSTTTTTTKPATPPRIVEFSAVTFGKQCRGGISWDLVWVTTDAADVLYQASGGTPQTGAASGSGTVCHPASRTGTSFVLTATGPGGVVQQVVTGQSGVL